jgi:hypothetical protein
MNPAYDWHGRVLQTALNEEPSLSLDFYSYGVMLRKREGDMLTEYPVDPAQVAVALAAKVTFDTGLLSGESTGCLPSSGHARTWAVPTRSPAVLPKSPRSQREPVRSSATRY